MASNIKVYFADLKASASTVSPASDILFTDVSASEFFLDYNSKHRFLTSTFSFLDAPAFNLNKATFDTLLFTDSLGFSVTKSLNDTATILDVLAISVDFNREKTDNFLLAEQSTFNVTKSVDDAFVVGEIVSLDLLQSKTDSISFTDNAPSFSISLPKIESVVIADSFATTTIFNRVFNDAFALDDSATIDSLTKDFQSNKTNVFGFSDLQVFSVEKSLQDSAVLAESLALSSTKNVSDTLGLSEDFDLTVTTVHSAVFNFSPLNTFTLNR